MIFNSTKTKHTIYLEMVFLTILHYFNNHQQIGWKAIYTTI